MVQLSHLYMITGKTIHLTIWTFAGKVMSFLFLICCLFGHSFLYKEQAHFNFMAAITVHCDFEASKRKICHCFYFSPLYLPWSDGTRYHDVSSLMLSFKTVFSLSSFTLIKRFFSSSSPSATVVVSSVYLRLLIFLPTILVPAYDSSSPHFAWCTLHIIK